MEKNRTWIAFGNRKRCNHADAIHNLGFINWRMGRQFRFAIGDIIYLFMSDERRVRFKLVVTKANCERQDKEYWEGNAPNDVTYKLELLDEYNGALLNESYLIEHGFNGGRSIETPSCNNIQLLEYINKVFNSI